MGVRRLSSASLISLMMHALTGNSNSNAPFVLGISPVQRSSSVPEAQTAPPCKRPINTDGTSPSDRSYEAEAVESSDELSRALSGMHVSAKNAPSYFALCLTHLVRPQIQEVFMSSTA